MVLELDKVSGANGFTERDEDGFERGRFGPLHQQVRGEAAEENVAGDEVRQDIGAVGDERRRRLEVGLLEAQGGALVVLVGQVEAAEIVEKGDALGGRVEG